MKNEWRRMLLPGVPSSGNKYFSGSLAIKREKSGARWYEVMGSSNTN